MTLINATLKHLALITLVLSIAPYICADNIENLENWDNVDSAKDTESSKNQENTIDIEQGLKILLNAKEQTLLNTMEQKHQAQSLINLMDTVKKLTTYPQDIINQLLGDSPNQQVLKQIIRSLKVEEEKYRAQEEQYRTSDTVPHAQTQQRPRLKATKPAIQQLTPVFAVVKSNNGITEGRVIFRTSIKGTIISVSEGDLFTHQSQEYQLLSVKQQPSQNGRFAISLKTPSKTSHYNWPR